MLGKHYLCAVITQDAAMFGQADRANSNANGNRQELWLTPKANESDSDPNFAARNADRGLHCHGTLSSQAKSQSWATPEAKNHLGYHVDQQGKKWPKLGSQAMQWATPQASDPQHSGPNQRDSSGRPALPAQAMKEQWASPHANCSTGAGQAPNKTGGENLQTQANGKLNPRWVETLMGLPVGWVMPSCASPVTIEPTNSDSSATESSPPPPNELFEFCLQS
jgi:hypothetical protein